MKLIADSGSTKTTWVLLESGVQKQRTETPGLNPYFHTADSVEAILKADLLPHLVPDHVREIHFYGAGCSTGKNDDLIRDALLNYFHKAGVYIYHDILGAARALFGRESGISCILGTGCNCCAYDGKQIRTLVDSLGYLFGDEGAGSYLGKKFLELYLKHKLPEDLHEAFEQTYQFSLEDILNSLYNRPYPNRFLASFSHFLAPRQSHPVIRKLVSEAFHDFFDAQVKRYPGYQEVPVGFIGSIAYHYQEILLETAAREGVRTGAILKDPIGGLIRYHQE